VFQFKGTLPREAVEGKSGKKARRLVQFSCFSTKNPKKKTNTNVANDLCGLLELPGVESQEEARQGRHVQPVHNFLHLVVHKLFFLLLLSSTFYLCLTLHRIQNISLNM
jgi:hypothetical protein